MDIYSPSSQSASHWVKLHMSLSRTKAGHIEGLHKYVLNE